MLKRLDKATSTGIMNALRAGTVPSDGLEHFAVGLEQQMDVLREQREWVRTGRSAFKFVRGGYGSGKTFLTSLAAAEATEANFLVSKVVISATDTPLYRLGGVYRRMCQNLSLTDRKGGSLQTLVDRWLYRLEDQVIEIDGMDEDDEAFPEAVAKKVETNLIRVGERAGRLAVCLKAYHKAKFENRFSDARGLLDWMSGDNKVGFDVKKLADVTGKVENWDVVPFLRGWLEIMEASGYSGLLVVLDEVETTMRLRRPERLKSLEVLRQLVDAIENNELPGLHLVMTGTPEFFEGEKGVPSLRPLHERIRVTGHRPTEPSNMRQPQVQLPSLDRDRLFSAAQKIRSLYPSPHPEALETRVPDAFIWALVDSMTEGFGGRVEVVPRLFLREFVHILDLVDQHDDYDPLRTYVFQKDRLEPDFMNSEERAAIQEIALGLSV
jgi:BREX system ATP-binding protein BrxC/D